MNNNLVLSFVKLAKHMCLYEDYPIDNEYMNTLCSYSNSNINEVINLFIENGLIIEKVENGYIVKTK